MKESNLIKFYISLLAYCGMVVDEDGFISSKTGDTVQPANLDGVRMALPYPNQLRCEKPSERVIFHPLNENILKGESRVLMCLRNIINIRLNYTIGVLGVKLLNIATSQDFHKRMNPVQSELLIKLGEVHKDAPENFLAMMLSNIENNASKLFVNIYLTKGATVNKTIYSRVGISSFPLYEQLVAEDKTKFLSKTTKRDDATYKALLEYMFPDIAKPESYNYGTDSDIATWFCSLMGTSIKFAARINDLIDMFGEFITDSEGLRFEADWIDQFNDIKSLQKEIFNIPMQAGNEGGNKLEKAIANKVTNIETPGSRLREHREEDSRHEADIPRRREEEAPARRETSNGRVSLNEFLRGPSRSRDDRDDRDYRDRDDRRDRYRDRERDRDSRSRPAYDLPSIFNDDRDDRGRRDDRPRERVPRWDTGGRYRSRRDYY